MKQVKNWFALVMTVMVLSVSAFAVEPGQAVVNLNVKGMKCSGCEAKVKSVLKDVKGVVSTESVSAANGTVSVVIDKKKTDEKAVAVALADKTGYDVTVSAPGAKTQKGNAKAACCSGQSKAACESKK